MKKISIVIPTYNEEENVELLAGTLQGILSNKLSQYEYEIIFIDNDSEDSTRIKIEGLCRLHPQIKAIFNAKNFGQMRSPFHALTQSSGDAVILMCADFQDPPEMLPQLIQEWEQGFKIVTAIKTKSKENFILYTLRSIYYKLIKYISHTDHIEHFTGFGLYDKTFIDVLRTLDDPEPYLRGIVAELGFKRKELPYQQLLRRAGTSKNNFYSLYDIAMLGITSHSKIPLRIAVFFGFFFSGLSFLVAMVYFTIKLLFWNTFNLGLAPLVIGVFLLGSVQLFFIGLLGEYILNINTRVIKRPIVVEERRINF
ncbi:MAG: glycosyltransferase family 2 protein [Brevinema sp.]